MISKTSRLQQPCVPGHKPGTHDPLPSGYTLTDSDFNRIRELLRELCWIHMGEGKRELVRGRLAKRLRALGLDSYSSYLDLVDNDEVELSVMVDSLTTNYTSFFRGEGHFSYLSKEVLEPLLALGRRRIRLWSAGCSSGEEAYSAAIVCKEALSKQQGTVDVLILATDVSDKVLGVARAGVYDKGRLLPVPPTIRRQYFAPADADGEKGRYKVSADLRQLVRFKKHNLAGPWPMKGPFNAVFCRNVMIYFAREAKIALLERFYRVIGPGGVLFIGHSESLKGLTGGFRYVAPGIYTRL